MDHQTALFCVSNNGISRPTNHGFKEIWAFLPRCDINFFRSILSEDWSDSLINELLSFIPTGVIRFDKKSAAKNPLKLSGSLEIDLINYERVMGYVEWDRGHIQRVRAMHKYPELTKSSKEDVILPEKFRYPNQDLFRTFFKQDDVFVKKFFQTLIQFSTKEYLLVTEFEESSRNLKSFYENLNIIVGTSEKKKRKAKKTKKQKAKQKKSEKTPIKQKAKENKSRKRKAKTSKTQRKKRKIG